MAGLVAVFVFAMQMINFPVAAGTSGHLLGGALAAILVGPYAGALAVSVVILVQGLLFADGGLSAIGLNIINMGLVTAAVGWFVFRAVVKVAGSSRPAVLDRRLRRGLRRGPGVGPGLRAGVRASVVPAPRRVSTVTFAMVGVHS